MVECHLDRRHSLGEGLRGILGRRAQDQRRARQGRRCGDREADVRRLGRAVHGQPRHDVVAAVGVGAVRLLIAASETAHRQPRARGS